MNTQRLATIPWKLPCHVKEVSSIMLLCLFYNFIFLLRCGSFVIINLSLKCIIVCHHWLQWLKFLLLNCLKIHIISHSLLMCELVVQMTSSFWNSALLVSSTWDTHSKEDADLFKIGLAKGDGIVQHCWAWCYLSMCWVADCANLWSALCYVGI